jgi:hypothetical protein
MTIEAHTKIDNVTAKGNALEGHYTKQADLTKLMILSKSSRNKSVETIKGAII